MFFWLFSSCFFICSCIVWNGTEYGIWLGFRLHLCLRYPFSMKKLQITPFQERFVESYTDMYKALINMSVCRLADIATLKCLENVISFLCRWGLWMDIIRIIAGVILLSPGLMWWRRKPTQFWQQVPYVQFSIFLIFFIVFEMLFRCLLLMHVELFA